MNDAKQRKRMLVVCQHYWPESFRINDICDSFVQHGFDVDILCGIPNYPKGTFYQGYSYTNNRKQEHNGVHVRRAFEIPRGENSIFWIFLNNISFPIATIFHLPRLLTRKYDQIFIYQLSPVMMALPGIIIGKLKRVKTTMWSIDPWPESLFSFLPVKNRILRKVATVVSHWHYRHVDQLVVLSERMRQQMLQTTSLDDGKVIVLPMACEKIYEQSIPDAKLAKRFSNNFNIFFAGTITPILSFETMLEATEILRSRGYKDIHWIIAGDGMARGWLEAEVQKRALKAYFSFEGFMPIEKIPRYTTNAADVLFSSLVQSDFLESTIPAKIPSYLAAGKPILLSMNGAAPELIEKIGCGLSSPAENALALAENIEKMYNMSPSQRNKLGNKARSYHFKHFERNTVMKTLINYIES